MRALAADDRRGGDAARVERRQARDAGFVLADAGVVDRAPPSTSYLSAVSGLPPSSPPCEPVTTIACRRARGRPATAESSAQTCGRLGDQQERRLQRCGRRRDAPRVLPAASSAAASRHDWPG